MSCAKALVGALVVLGLSACERAVLAPVPVTTSAGDDISAPGKPALSAAARQVSQIAKASGDQNYLMIDKKRGEIIVFESGQATFSGAALTGENPADHMPDDAWDKPFSALRDVKYKITPAGRFTLSSGYDPHYGKTLDVNEVRGQDWDIAIHLVWLGAPSERRGERLRSANALDKHITYGCIDLDADTMRQVLNRVGDKDQVPIYILPTDESLTPSFFQPRAAMRNAPTPAG